MEHKTSPPQTQRIAEVGRESRSMGKEEQGSRLARVALCLRQSLYEPFDCVTLVNQAFNELSEISTVQEF